MGHAAEPAHPGELPRGLRERLAHTKAALFDFDGTVVDTVELITASFRHTISTVLGLDLPDEELIQNLGMPLLAQMKVFSEERADELVDVYREHNRAHHDEMIVEIPGAKTTLEALRQAGLRLVVVTSKSRELAQRGMDIFQLRALFDDGVYMEDTAVHKPNPEPVLEALRRIEVGPVEAVFVGDSPHDIAAGRAAGVLTIAALWGPFARERLLAARPDVSLKSVDQLVPLLAGKR